MRSSVASIGSAAAVDRQDPGRLVQSESCRSTVVMALVLAALIDRRHPGRPLPHRRQWTAPVLLVAGLALFLTTATPRAGAGRVGDHAPGQG